MTKTKVAGVCPICHKKRQVLTRHLKGFHEVKNKKERDLLNRYVTGQKAKKGGLCPISGCFTHVAHVRKHVLNSHRELTTNNKLAILKKAVRREVIQEMARLRARNPNPPLVSTLDLPQDEEGPCPRTHCARRRDMVEELKGEVERLQRELDDLRGGDSDGAGPSRRRPRRGPPRKAVILDSTSEEEEEEETEEVKKEVKEVDMEAKETEENEAEDEEEDEEEEAMETEMEGGEEDEKEEERVAEGGGGSDVAKAEKKDVEEEEKEAGLKEAGKKEEKDVEEAEEEEKDVEEAEEEEKEVEKEKDKVADGGGGSEVAEAVKKEVKEVDVEAKETEENKAEEEEEKEVEGGEEKKKEVEKVAEGGGGSEVARAEKKDIEEEEKEAGPEPKEVEKKEVDTDREDSGEEMESEKVDREEIHQNLQNIVEEASRSEEEKPRAVPVHAAFHHIFMDRRRGRTSSFDLLKSINVGMRVGSDYQAAIPDFEPGATKYSDKETGGMLVWSPYHAIGDSKLDEYIAIAKEKHGYNVEQTLGMLFWHKHNIEKSLAVLPNFIPFPDEWTVEDKVLFEQAFSFHGKSFHRIQQMLPDRSISSLVKYYYSWKKTRSRTSLMDRQARKLASRSNQDDSDEEMEEANPIEANDSDYDPNKEAKKEVSSGTSPAAASCSSSAPPLSSSGSASSLHQPLPWATSNPPRLNPRPPPNASGSNAPGPAGGAAQPP